MSCRSATPHHCWTFHSTCTHLVHPTFGQVQLRSVHHADRVLAQRRPVHSWLLALHHGRVVGRQPAVRTCQPVLQLTASRPRVQHEPQTSWFLCTNHQQQKQAIVQEKRLRLTADTAISPAISFLLAYLGSGDSSTRRRQLAVDQA